MEAEQTATQPRDRTKTIWSGARDEKVVHNASMSSERCNHCLLIYGLCSGVLHCCLLHQETRAFQNSKL